MNSISTLHIVSRQLDAPALASLRRSTNPGDSLLLSCDAVYLALRPDFLAQAGDCVALASDVEARGLRALWPATIALIDHAGFVALCVQHGKSLSWA